MSSSRPRSCACRRSCPRYSPRSSCPRSLATAAFYLTFVASSGAGRPARAEAPAVRAAAPATPASSRHVRLDTLARAGDRFTAALEGGAQAELTLDPGLQD